MSETVDPKAKHRKAAGLACSLLMIVACIGAALLTVDVYTADTAPIPTIPEFESYRPAEVNESYAELADRAGWPGGKVAAEAETNRSALIEQKNEFVKYLREKGIRVYDEAKVSAYLDDLVAKKTREETDRRTTYRWNWFPVAGRTYGGNLEVIDSVTSGDQTSITFRTGTGDFSSFIISNGYGRDVIDQQISANGVSEHYVAPIPKDIVAQMAMIKDEWPCAEFDVTAISRVLDPFLRVRFEWGEMIIAKWDEPGFE